LPELLDQVARKPLQVEMSAVRILFELFGFLLERPLVVGLWPFKKRDRARKVSSLVQNNFSLRALRVAPDEGVRGYILSLATGLHPTDSVAQFRLQ